MAHVQQSLDTVQLAFKWVDDLISGDMIEGRGYTKTYFFVWTDDRVIIEELNNFCDLLNLRLRQMDKLGQKNNLHICWEAGELRPQWSMQK